MNGKKGSLAVLLLVVIMCCMMTGCGIGKKAESELLSIKLTANKMSCYADNNSVIVFSTVGTYADGTIKTVEPDCYYMLSQNTNILRRYISSALKPFNNEVGKFDIVAQLGKVKSDTITVEYKEVPKIAKIVLTGDTAKIKADNNDVLTVSVKVFDKDNIEITSYSGVNYYVKKVDSAENEVELLNKKFKTLERGIYKIYAKFENVISNEYTVEAAEGAELNSIEVIKLPNKINYYINEEIELDGIVVIGHYSDSTTRAAIIGKEHIYNVDTSTIGTKTVNIDYNNRTATFQIFVIEKPAVSEIAILTGIKSISQELQKRNKISDYSVLTSWEQREISKINQVRFSFENCA